MLKFNIIKKMQRLTVVTGNKNKLNEIIRIFGKSAPNLEIVSQEIDLPELQGEPEEICKQKVKLAAQRIDGLVVVEDTSLCFNALQGLPGPYVKWFYDKIGNHGLYNLLSAYPDKTGYAQCIFALHNNKLKVEPILFVGKCFGTIVEPKGNNNFGWDPIFKPDDHEQTFAEMDQDIKNKISHRTIALNKLKDYLIN